MAMKCEKDGRKRHTDQFKVHHDTRSLVESFEN